MANLTRYTEEQIERGLTELALCGGNWRLAAARLQDHYELAIPADTLKSWRYKTHPVRYEDTRRRLLPKVQARIAEEAEDLAIDYAHVERATLAAFVDTVETLNAKDAAGAIRNLATAKAINVDKAQLLRGQPTQIIEQRPAREILKEIRRRAGSVDGTAEEVELSDAVLLPAVTSG